jgi:hypothetical protein
MMPIGNGDGASGRTNALSATVLRSVLDHLSLAIFVFRRERLVYTNPPATRLINRLRTKYRIELLVMLLDHLAQFREGAQQIGTVIALTGQDNEPFVVHLMELPGRRGDVAVSIREIGTDVPAFRDRYSLSRREIQVVELVLRGSGLRRRRPRSICPESSRRSASIRGPSWPASSPEAGTEFWRISGDILAAHLLPK